MIPKQQAEDCRIHPEELELPSVITNDLIHLVSSHEELRKQCKEKDVALRVLVGLFHTATKENKELKVENLKLKLEKIEDYKL